MDCNLVVMILALMVLFLYLYQTENFCNIGYCEMDHQNYKKFYGTFKQKYPLDHEKVRQGYDKGTVRRPLLIPSHGVG